MNLIILFMYSITVDEKKWTIKIYVTRLKSGV